jgi:hypothetical protein
MNDESCILALLPLPAVDPDGRANDLSPSAKAAAVAFLREGVVPDPVRSTASPDYLAELVRVGALRTDHELTTLMGVEAIDDPRGLADRLTAMVGAPELKRIRKALAGDTTLGFDDVVRDELLDFALLPELVVGLLAAEGGLAVSDVSDDCTAEERIDLRRRNSDAITDWARAETATITANFQNGTDGLTRFTDYLAAENESVASGIGGALGVGALALWLFGVKVPLAGVVLGLVGSAVAAAVGSGSTPAAVRADGASRLAGLRDRANADLASKVGQLRNEVVSAGNDCPRLRALLRQNQNLPRTASTSGQEVYLQLLIAWGRGRYGDWLTPPNSQRSDPELRDKWILYGGFTDLPFVYDGYDLVDEINKVAAGLRRP